MKRWIRPLRTEALVAPVYIVVIAARAGGAPWATTTLGTRFSKGDPQGSKGYDEQWASAWAPADLISCLDLHPRRQP